MIFKSLKLASLLLIAPMSALATPILVVNDSGQLTGASGVSVSGSSYNVNFFGGSSCNDMFNGCDPVHFIFGSSETAESASNALLTQVFLNQYDAAPNLVLGCNYPNICYIVTAFETNGDTVRLAYAENNANDLEDRYGTRAQGISVAGILPGVATWAVWSEAGIAEQRVLAPEPGTLVLFGLGMAGMAFRRKK